MCKIFIISIGNEILLGKTINTNLAYLGETLFQNGYKIKASTTIQDEPDIIKETIQNAWDKYDVIISTGGLGPTKDDLTRKSIAHSFGKSLKFNQNIWERIKNKRLRNSQRPLEILRSMAKLPRDFIPLKNKVGTAPGLHYTNNKKEFFALPGVPSEMKHIFESSVIPYLTQNLPGKKRFIKTIRTASIREVDLHEKLKEIKDTSESKIAFLPKPGLVDIRIESSNREELDRLLQSIQSKVGRHIYGFDDDTIQSTCHEKLMGSNKTLAIAESCTGGLIQNYFTDNPGSSEYFLGGIVSYSNFAKKKFLGVKQKTLNEQGAVSRETVQEMLKGTKSRFDSDIAIAVSGIAGPSGGAKEKPVGLVYVGVLIDGKKEIRECNFNGNRLQIKKQSAVTALFMLLKLLK